MSPSAVIKKNASSLQVLKTLFLLLQGNYTMAELVKILNAKENNFVFNNSVVSKYINTCRYCGIDIQKLHNKYFVTNSPWQLKLSDKELELINQLQDTARFFLAERTNNIFNQFIQNINKFLNKKTICQEQKTLRAIQEIFLRAVNSRSKIALLYEGNYIVCNPIQLVNSAQTNFLHVIASGEEKWLLEDKVTGIEILEQKYIPDFSEQRVVFKLRGNLSKKYDVRENECVTGFSDDEIIISNIGEEREALFARLMRYDICCEILYPLKYREDFKKLIENTLKNYGSSDVCCN